MKRRTTEPRWSPSKGIRYESMLILFAAGIVGTLLLWQLLKKPPVDSRTTTVAPSQQTHSDTPTPVPPTPETQPTPPAPALHEPIAEFKSRITKKKFGTYVTPANSPVQPERFSGYHNAVDVEYTDRADEVPVYAIADAEVANARWVSGYGGVVVIRCVINGTTHAIVYGHLDPDQLPASGTKVAKGAKLGVLGAGSTRETDGERRHLHFGVRKDASIDLRGYVSSQAGLNGWIDPLTLPF